MRKGLILVLFCFVLIPLSFLLVGCGTMSGLQTSNSQAQSDQKSSETKIDLSKYNTVVVLDFEDGTSGDRKTVLKQAGADFADMIAAEIKKKGAFSKVLREPTTEEAIVVSGRITRYQEGNAALRIAIGLGAGSSYFDATASVNDNKTKVNLGNIIIDRNSWVLGGWMAGAQTVESFMQAGAKQVAKELTKAKLGKDTEEEEKKAQQDED